jgi:hypothetical protein
VPVIDGVVDAVKLAESLVTLGLKTSKRRGYARPIATTYADAMHDFSPARGVGSSDKSDIPIYRVRRFDGRALLGDPIRIVNASRASR